MTRENTLLILKRVFSKTAVEAYRASTCAGCGSFVGKLFQTFDAAPSAAIDIGAKCSGCGKLP